MEIGTIYPGHGETFTGHKALIDKRFAAYEGRKQKILQFLQQRPKTVYELVQDTFPKLSVANVFLGVSEIIGHLDLLEDDGLVTVHEQNGVWYYERVVQKKQALASLP
jgi:DNA-binding PadR family transcriptional regulator